MWVYNLFDKIENLTEAIKFVEIVDDENGDFSNETESAMIIRHAREAMVNLGTEYGAAVSDIYSSVNAEGKTVYFAYTALVDKRHAPCVPKLPKKLFWFSIIMSATSEEAYAASVS